jgi:hypothetical protein
MADTTSNPVQFDVPGPSVDLKIFRSSPTRGHFTATLADEAIYNLGTMGADKAGLYFCYNVANQDDAAFFVVTASTVHIGPSFASHSWDDAATDPGLNFYTDGTDLLLENNSGGAASLGIIRVADF